MPGDACAGRPVMKTAPFISLVLAAFVAGCPLSAAPSAGAKSGKLRATAAAGAQSGFVVKGEDWADCAALEKRLAAQILRNIKGESRQAVQQFIANPANRLLLAQWHLAHCENAVDASKLPTPKAGEKLPPRTMRELLLSSDKAAAFVTRVTNDVAWMEQLAYSGECVRPGRAMAILYALSQQHKGYEKQRVLRDIATATALEWARSDWDFARALARADFYMDNYAEGRFHSGFSDLPFWQYRVICGSKGNNANGDVASLEWALDNVHLPAEQYTGCCWQCNYLLDNLFGDSIHGAYYYAPYDDVYADKDPVKGTNALKRARDIGGVCGSLSHYGAFAAVANGVPALPAGEPGHCAYIVCVNGKWTPAYSLSWERGLHWQMWTGVHKYSSLHMATELNSEVQARRTALSHACRTLGELCAASGRSSAAKAYFLTGVREQPLNYPAWRGYAAYLSSHEAQNAAEWKLLNKELCARLASRYPEMAAELLKGQVYPGLRKACTDSSQLMVCYGLFWKAVKDMGPDRWAVEELCNNQLGSVKSSKRSAEEVALVFYKMVLGQTAVKKAYAPVILSWGNGKAVAMGEAMQKKFLRATLSALSKGEGMDADARDKMLGQALLGAERMRDRSSFQAIGKLLSDKFRQPRLPKWEPFPGKLVSQGGLLYTSSTCQHDWPAEHWGVLEPTGGRFHTGNDKDAYAVVELPKMSVLSGVVTIAPDGNLWRLFDMKVQYSESGRDDDWHDAGAMPNPTGQRVNRLDLQGRKLRARYIRILRPGGPQLFHLNAIFVYGTPAS